MQAFRAIEGNGISRADFFIRKNDGALLINEVNTMPGFTPYSMYPLLWRETGVSYAELLDRMIEPGTGALQPQAGTELRERRTGVACDHKIRRDMHGISD